MFIVTNTICGGEYTPSVFKDKKEAEKWLLECTASNIKNLYDDEVDFFNMCDKEIVEWAKENLENFRFSKTSSYVEYDSYSYNLMNMYEIIDDGTIEEVLEV